MARVTTWQKTFIGSKTVSLPQCPFTRLEDEKHIRSALVKRYIGLNHSASLKFLQHRVRYLFQAEKGTLTRGVPAGYAAAPVKELIDGGDDPPPVWPYAESPVRGFSFAPFLAQKRSAGGPRRQPALCISSAGRCQARWPRMGARPRSERIEEETGSTSACWIQSLSFLKWRRRGSA